MTYLSWRHGVLAVLFIFVFHLAHAKTELPPNLATLRQAGMDALFNMDYPLAKEKFEEMTKVAPDHPAGFVYLADTIWLGRLAELRRLQTGLYGNDAFFSKNEDPLDPKVDKEFRAAFNNGVTKAEALLDKNKNDTTAMYYLGMAKTTLAGYEATVSRSFFSALRNGSKGVDLHRDVLKKDPSFIDAGLSVGIYEYITGTLPLAIKLVALLGGVHGSKTKGLALLQQVAKDGNFAKDDAKVILIVLYNREKQWSESLKLLEDLSARYPSNSLFRLEKGAVLAHMSRFRDSIEVFEQMLTDSPTMAYMPDLVHFEYAVALANANSWEKAYEHFHEAYSSPKIPEALCTVAHLEAGICLDMLKRRPEAIAEYQTVLKRRNVFDCQDRANQYLKTPYSP